MTSLEINRVFPKAVPLRRVLNMCPTTIAPVLAVHQSYCVNAKCAGLGMYISYRQNLLYP